MRAADWRVAGDVIDLPVLGVFAVKAGTGGGELRSIQIYVRVANTKRNQTHTYLFTTQTCKWFPSSTENVLTQVCNYVQHTSSHPLRYICNITFHNILVLQSVHFYLVPMFPLLCTEYT
jgi:hypothetical protein